MKNQRVISSPEEEKLLCCIVLIDWPTSMFSNLMAVVGMVAKMMMTAIKTMQVFSIPVAD